MEKNEFGSKYMKELQKFLSKDDTLSYLNHPIYKRLLFSKQNFIPPLLLSENIHSNIESNDYIIDDLKKVIKVSQNKIYYLINQNDNISEYTLDDEQDIKNIYLYIQNSFYLSEDDQDEDQDDIDNLENLKYKIIYSNFVYILYYFINKQYPNYTEIILDKLLTIYDNFEERYENFKSIFLTYDQTEVDNTIRKLDQNKNLLAKYYKNNVPKFFKDNRSISFNLPLKNDHVDYSLIDIFYNIKIDDTRVYCVYRKEDSVMRKVNQNTDLLPKYNILNKKHINNTINLFVKIGKIFIEIDIKIQDTLVVFYFKNIITSITDQQIDDIFMETFSFLDLSKYKRKEYNISGRYYILNKEMDKQSFIHYITTDSLFSSYFLVSEISKPISMKTTKDNIISKVYYKSSLKLPTTVPVKSYSVGQINISLRKGGTYLSEQDRMIPPNEDFIFINVLKCKNFNYLNNMIYTLFYLIDDYNKKLPGIKNIFNLIFDQTDETETTQQDVKLKDMNVDRVLNKIGVLQFISPSAFGFGYSRTGAQKSQQPYYITDSEMRQYKDEEIKKLIKQYKILQFKVEEVDKPINLTCDVTLLKDYVNREDFDIDTIDTSLKYIGVIENNNVANNKTYPYLPKCFGKTTGNVIPNMQKYRNFINKGVVYDSNKSITDPNKIFKSSKINNIGSISVLPQSIDDFILTISDSKDNKRYTVIDRNNFSFIHCILYILDPDYLTKSFRSNDGDDRINYALNLLDEILDDSQTNDDQTAIHLACCLQENYDKSVDEIDKILSMDETFFDSKLYYRLFELYFNINIFVVSYDNEEKISYLEIPRYKNKHIRHRNNNPSVILFRNKGSEIDRNNFINDNYDIVTINGQLIFNNNITQKLFDSYFDYLKMVEWEFSKGVLKNKLVTEAYNIASDLEKYSVCQYVNTEGKANQLILRTSKGKINVLIPEIAPQNLHICEKNEINRLKLQEIVDLFGQPDSIFINDNKVDGVWYNYSDTQIYFFCSSLVNDSVAKYKIGKRPNYTDTNIETSNMLLVEFQSKILTELMSWFYFSLINRGNITSYNQLIKFFRVKKSNVDYENLNYYLPKITGARVIDIIKNLSSKINLFSSDGYINFNCQDLKNKIIYHLKILEFYNEGNKVKQTNRLDILYKYNFLFLNQDNMFFIDRIKKSTKSDDEDDSDKNEEVIEDQDINQVTFINWLKNNKVGIFSKTLDLSKIITSITTKDLIKMDNQIRIIKIKNNFYILQKVVDNIINYCLSISDYWDKNKVNKGHDFIQLEIPEEYNQYTLNDNNIITLTQYNQNNIYVLKFNDKDYASLLPLY